MLFANSRDDSFIPSCPVKNSNLFTPQGSSGPRINHPVMDGHPMPGSCAPPVLIELQHLILPGYWRLIYMIQLQSKLWFFTVKDSSIWRVCTETIKDQNRAQKNSPQIRGLADYSVLAPQLSAPRRIIKWSSSKEKKRDRWKKQERLNDRVSVAHSRTCDFIWTSIWNMPLGQICFRSLTINWHTQEHGTNWTYPLSWPNVNYDV